MQSRFFNCRTDLHSLRQTDSQYNGRMGSQLRRRVISSRSRAMRCVVWRTFVFCALAFSGRGQTSNPCTPPNFPPPQFRAATFNVREFGATGNGRDNDTAAINCAIEKCNANSGGDVVFPRGTYLAASIHLKSNVRLVLDKDAIISGAKNGYDLPEPNEFEKYQDFGHSHFHNALMWGDNIDNFAIVGGRVNGGYIVKGDEGQGGDIGDKVIAITSSPVNSP